MTADKSEDPRDPSAQRGPEREPTDASAEGSGSEVAPAGPANAASGEQAGGTADELAAKAERAPVDPVARTKSLMIGCFGVTLVTAGFLAADVVRMAGQYGAGAWIGAVLSAGAILGLAGVYLLCGLGRLELESKLTDRFTVFHLSAVMLVVGIGADVLIPGRDTGGLALLLPWGIGYWLHNLKQQAEADKT